MTKLTNDDVLKLARLARLQLSPNEVSQFSEEINSILRYVEQLQAIDLSSYEPTAQVTGLINVSRADIVKDYGTSPEQLLANAPALSAGQLKVKRMIS
ncbi:MAG: Asp-tRNA(Asn)/Glu-tRNA(Gln) amidotransferase subunit GatC [Candidatus Saccharimonadales bacterium]